MPRRIMELASNPSKEFRPHEIGGRYFEKMTLKSVSKMKSQPGFALHFISSEGRDYWLKASAELRISAEMIKPVAVYEAKVGEIDSVLLAYQSSHLPVGQVLLAVVICDDGSTLMYFGSSDSSSGVTLRVIPEIVTPDGDGATIRLESGEWWQSHPVVAVTDGRGLAL